MLQRGDGLQDLAAVSQPLADALPELETAADAYVAAWKARQETCTQKSRAAWNAQAPNRSAVDVQARDSSL